MSRVPAIIDVEASGFGRNSYPIEVGFVLSDGESHCGLIKPHSDWTHWDESAEAVHGINPDMLQSHGKDVRETAEILNTQLNGLVLYTDGWSFDSSWLARLFDAAGLIQRFRLETLVSVLSEDQMAVWHETKEEVIQNMSLARHRASSDALILQKTWRLTRERTSMSKAG